ncbi:ParB N-terminal domain-containing protein [Caulobacter soli]|uniref:ParB N-terminal domain-containing protein n=1 Tax=Caulobacter soli TaxID=2708539 RepID=UPI0013EB2B44|nr:ParB N-terminal domain-containing protein [Caulobacter soli]
MARDVPNTAPADALEVAAEVYWIPTDQVEVGDRIRPVSQVAAEGLAAVMLASEAGQEEPIEVCRLPGRAGFHLVEGAHRLEAVKINGWPKVKALIVGANAIDRALREVSAQLFSVELSPIDRAAFIGRHLQLLKAKAGVAADATPQSIAATARWSQRLQADVSDASDTMSAAYGFTTEAAEALGFNERTIRRDLELHRGLRPDVVAQLRAHPVAKNASQLRALAKLAEGDQRAVASMIVDDGVKDVTAALALRSQKPKPSAADKAFNAFVAGWSRMGARERRLALAEIAKIGLPTGVTLDLGARDDG